MTFPQSVRTPDKVQKYIRDFAVYTAVNFNGMPLKSFREYDDDWFRRYKQRGACVLLLNHLKSLFPFDEMNVLRQYLHMRVAHMWSRLETVGLLGVSKEVEDLYWQIVSDYEMHDTKTLDDMKDTIKILGLR